MSFTNFALFEKNPLTYTASFPEWVTTGQLVLYVYYPYKDDSGETHKFYDTLSTSKDTIWDITPN
ncbi:MAG: hypothetical protein KC517_09135 [Bacteroidetes bacterium]|nr:hypothetical protein [Bacteroidota bacterium]